jgi:hypothetical protein
MTGARQHHPSKKNNIPSMDDIGSFATLLFYE